MRHWYVIGRGRIWWPDGETPKVATQVHRFTSKKAAVEFASREMFAKIATSKDPLVRKAVRLMNSDSPEGRLIKTYGFPVEITSEIDHEGIKQNAHTQMLPGMQELGFEVGDVRPDEAPGSLQRA